MENERQDPGTLVALIFRIVDVPRRTVAVVALALLVIVTARIAQLPIAEFARSWVLWGAGAGTAGVCWHSRRRRRRRGRYRPSDW